jgi:S-adenosylmethionine/arginine decarboxylase-like enzyme
MATKKKKAEVTKAVVVKGSHLTVTTYPDGRTELEWDDEALLRDVRAALLKAESTISVSIEEKPKRTRKKKDVEA